jgi:hypothetical protein
MYPVNDTVYTGVHMGHATMKYIPTLFAGKLLDKFYNAATLTETCNTDYEGEIRKQGDKVEIRALPDIDNFEHEKGDTLTYSVPNSESVTLEVDKGRAWAFRVDDPDPVQTDIKGYLNQWTENASINLRNKIEQLVYTNVQTHVGHKGAGNGVAENVDLGSAGSPVALTKGNIVDQIVDLGMLLDENNIPATNRWMLLSPAIAAMIKKSELKDASLSGDGTSMLRNGRLGVIDRFTLFMTNNVPFTSADKAWSLLFGTKHGMTFATQLTKSEGLVNPTGFGMLYRGLQVYGYKVVLPKCVGNLYATVG